MIVLSAVHLDGVRVPSTSKRKIVLFLLYSDIVIRSYLLKYLNKCLFVYK
ncbi:hypothetical protein NBO_360g0006 [Nosema bombycis CQ1]|uniref:Uncharacterized protein n=1 Tax=Nosema bombycis (strain CQ1 / CVCC 102059) TaxID=578461 RepID=R0KRJ8_NOSB1|nr:hypothetical protein NBO_360g0006 [Nosema bombycis CQ1]|eukprot:EOB12837.1 hypothetical protein NBO_360g0006 [Nosema bombycis CQ1]